MCLTKSYLAGCVENHTSSSGKVQNFVPPTSGSNQSKLSCSRGCGPVPVAVGRAAQDSGEARSAGLVPFSTSDTRADGDSETVLIDTKATRLRRMKSGVMTAARLINGELDGTSERWRPWMITPTYRPGEAWKPTHITDLVKCLRAWAGRRGLKLRYVWVAEIQQRRYRAGALPGECVHYHLLLWLPARFSCPKPDKQGWWRFGMTNCVRVRRPLRYILKYTSKGDSIEFPKGLRIHGCGGLNKDQRNERTWWLLPRWVRTLWSADQQPRRANGGGFVVRATGEWYPSIWEVFSTGGSVICSIRDGLFEWFSLHQLAQVFCNAI